MKNVQIMPATPSNQNNASSPADKLIPQRCSQTKIQRPCLTIEHHLIETSNTNLSAADREIRSLGINFKERLLSQAYQQRAQQRKQTPPRYEMKRAFPKPKVDNVKLPEKHELSEVFSLNLSNVPLTDTHDIPKTLSSSDSHKSLVIRNTNVKTVKDVLSKYADPIRTDVTSQNSISYGFEQKLKPVSHKITRKTLFHSIHDILKAERPGKVDPEKAHYRDKKQSKENIIPHSSSGHSRKSFGHRDRKRAVNRIPIETPPTITLENPIRRSINVVYIEPVKSRTLQYAVQSKGDKDIVSLKGTIEPENTSEKSMKINDLKGNVKIPEKYSNKNTFNKYYQNILKTTIVRDDLQQNFKGHVNAEEVAGKTISNQGIESKSRIPKDQVEMNKNIIGSNSESKSSVESNLRISNSKEKSSTATIPDQDSGNQIEISKENMNKQRESPRQNSESKVVSKRTSANLKTKKQTIVFDNTTTDQYSVSERESSKEKINEKAEQEKNARENFKLKAVSKKAPASSKTKELSMIFDKMTSDQNSASELKIVEENAEQKDHESIKSSYYFEESVVSVVHFKANNAEKVTGKKRFDRPSKSPAENVKRNIHKVTKQRRRFREKLRTSTLSNSKAKKDKEISEKTVSHHRSGSEREILKEKINENAKQKKKPREKTKSKAVSKKASANSKTKELTLILDKTMPDQNSRNKRENAKEKIHENDEQKYNSHESISSSINLKESAVNLKESVEVHFRTNYSKSAPESVKNIIHKSTKKKRRSRERLRSSVQSKKPLSNSKVKKIREMFDKSISYHYSGSEPEISKVQINKSTKQNESSREIHKTSSESEKTLVNSEANNVDSNSEIGREHSSEEINKSTKQKELSHERPKSSTERNKSLLNSKTEKITNIFDKKIPKEYSESEPKSCKPKRKIKKKIISGYIFREKSNTDAKAKEKIVPLKKTLNKIHSKEDDEKLMDLKSFPDSDAIKQLRRTLKLKAPWRSKSWKLEDAFHKRKQYETYVLAHQYLMWKRKRELRHILKEQEKDNVNEVQNSIVPKKRKRRRKRQSSEVVCFRKNKYKDPTALLNYYKCQWDRFQTKFPGESVHSELRQIIHEKMQAQPNSTKK